jgi:hypothetical protein
VHKFLRTKHIASEHHTPTTTEWRIVDAGVDAPRVNTRNLIKLAVRLRSSNSKSCKLRFEDNFRVNTSSSLTFHCSLHKYKFLYTRKKYAYDMTIGQAVALLHRQWPCISFVCSYTRRVSMYVSRLRVNMNASTFAHTTTTGWCL